MPTPHRIRLHGPWELRTNNATSSLTVPNTLPVGGSVSLYRRFGQPTNLNQESVWLVLDGVRGIPTLTLNGTSLAAVADYAEIDITTLLQQRNLLEVAFTDATVTDGITGAVYLEIREADYINDV